MPYVLLDGTVALRIVSAEPIATAGGLDVGGALVFGVTFAQVSAFPDDLVKSNYLFDGSVFTPNPGYTAPPLEPDVLDRQAIDAILDKDDADITGAELKTLALKAFRRMRRLGTLE